MKGLWVENILLCLFVEGLGLIKLWLMYLYEWFLILLYCVSFLFGLKEVFVLINEVKRCFEIICVYVKFENNVKVF